MADEEEKLEGFLMCTFGFQLISFFVKGCALSSVVFYSIQHVVLIACSVVVVIQSSLGVNQSMFLFLNIAMQLKLCG